MTASRQLAAFLKRHGIKQSEAAKALGVRPSVLYYWLKGSRPSDESQQAIERYTQGEVPASAWLTPSERAHVERIVPFAEATDQGEEVSANGRARDSSPAPAGAR